MIELWYYFLLFLSFYFNYFILKDRKKYIYFKVAKRRMRNPYLPSAPRQSEGSEERKATSALRPRKGDFKHHKA
jgi:hypothetical protein